VSQMKADVQSLKFLSQQCLQNHDFPPLISSNNGGQSSTSTHRQHDHAVSAATVVREAAKTSALSQQRTSDISSAKQDMLAAIADISKFCKISKDFVNDTKFSCRPML